MLLGELLVLQFFPSSFNHYHRANSNSERDSSSKYNELDYSSTLSRGICITWKPPRLWLANQEPSQTAGEMLSSSWHEPSSFNTTLPSPFHSISSHSQPTNR
jgi:hypothetical protein